MYFIYPLLHLTALLQLADQNLALIIMTYAVDWALKANYLYLTRPFFNISEIQTRKWERAMTHVGGMFESRRKTAVNKSQ